MAVRGLAATKRVEDPADEGEQQQRRREATPPRRLGRDQGDRRPKLR
jgi:hypothetical protein